MMHAGNIQNILSQLHSLFCTIPVYETYTVTLGGAWYFEFTL